MVAYQFYCQDEYGNQHLVGVLPERRMNSERITEESILNWGWDAMGDNADVNDVHFVKVEW